MDQMKGINAKSDGIEPQTTELLKILTARKPPFVVELNKIDMCYNWKADKDAPFLSTLERQKKVMKPDCANFKRHCCIEKGASCTKDKKLSPNATRKSTWRSRRRTSSPWATSPAPHCDAEHDECVLLYLIWDSQLSLHSLPRSSFK